MSTSENNKRIAKNTLMLYFRMLLNMVIGVFTSRVILQSLGAEDYGIYNVVGGIVTIVGFLNGALSASSSRFLTLALGERNRERQLKVFGASLNLHICVALLVFIFGETIGLWFFYEKMIIPENRMIAAFWVYQFSIVSTMLTFTQVPYSASLIAHEDMSMYAYIGLYEGFSKLLIAYLITVSPIDNLIFYGLLLMINSALIQIYYRCYVIKHYVECRFTWITDKKIYKDLLSYGSWDLLGNLAVICQSQGINILLNLFFGPVINAARAIAVQIQGLVTMFVGNFLVAVRPQVIKKYAEGDFDSMFSLTFNAAKFSYVLMLALVIPICYEVRFILNIWLGDGVPSETHIFVIIVLCTYTLRTFHTSALMPFHAIGRIKTGNLIGGSLMIATLPISYILLKFGTPAYSVFIAILIVEVLVTVLVWYLIRIYVFYSLRKLAFSVFLPSILVTIVSLLPGWLICEYVSSGWLRMLVLVGTTELVLFLSVFLVMLNSSERSRVLIYVKNKIYSKNEEHI